MMAVKLNRKFADQIQWQFFDKINGKLYRVGYEDNNNNTLYYFWSNSSSSAKYAIRQQFESKGIDWRRFLQQAADERAKAQRLSEDDYKFLSQVEKDRLQRTMKGVDTRQRIATRGTLIQQGQLGNQQLAQESMRNRGSVMAAGAGSTFA